MPADLTIGSIAPATPDSLRASSPAATRSATQATGTALPALAPATTASPRLPENRVVLDPASDRVVLEYFDSTGALVNSLPSQRQLDAYRLAASSLPDIKKS